MIGSCFRVALKIAALAFSLPLLLASAGCHVAINQAQASPSGSVMAAAESGDVLELVNRERLAIGLEALRMDAEISQVSQKFADDMLARGYFSHVSPDGQTMQMRLAGIANVSWEGENIAEGYQTAADVVKGWMESPGHRENILKPEYRRMGIGRAGNIWAQDFTD